MAPARRRVCQVLRSASCQQAKTNRPPGRRCSRRLENAAIGSSKNITPNWLTMASKGSGSSRDDWASAWTNVRLATPSSVSAPAGQLNQGAGEVHADHTTCAPDELRRRKGGSSAARSDVEDRQPGPQGSGAEQSGRDGTRQTLTVGPRLGPTLVVPPAPFGLVGMRRGSGHRKNVEERQVRAVDRARILDNLWSEDQNSAMVDAEGGKQSRHRLGQHQRQPVLFIMLVIIGATTLGMFLHSRRGATGTPRVTRRPCLGRARRAELR